MKEYLIPSMEQIKTLYNEIIPLMKELKTKEDVVAFEKKHKVTMEINYDLADKFDVSQPIEVIRCEHWGDLDYIYVYTDNIAPHFDVWCDFMEYDFIDGISIDELEKSYIEGIKWLWYRSKNRLEDLKEIISIMRQHGVEYNDMIDVYKFDTDIVEQYEDEHYEHGYGDIKTDKPNNDLEEKIDMIYDVCVYGYVYIVEAENENEAKLMACDEYYEETGLTAYTDDEAVVWKIHGKYPYEWK